MKAMQPASARALTGAATLLMFVGFLVPSPSGAFLAFCLTALVYAVPAIFGSGKVRLLAAILLLCSLGLAAGRYPDFQREQERYRHPAPTTGSTQPPADLG